MIHEEANYEEAMSLIANIEENNSLLLSAFPKFIDREGKVRRI